jgi:hypothetical protein
MADQGSIVWLGGSGTQYTYWIYALPAGLGSGQDGNYIYSKIVNNIWVPIYIGQGDLGDRTDINNHHQSLCLRRKGATHVHVHLNALEAGRTSEEADLLAGHPSAYEPSGCNERTGG